MPIRKLTEADQTVEIQNTAFSVDVAGRYICNTWDEATNNGGAPFDAVVLGAGMFGAYCAEKLYRRGADRNLRVLVLEAGSFLVSEHVQNLARIGLNVPNAITVDPGVARERVWGLPWRSNQASPGLAYCIGGRSIYWGGWSPRLTAADLQQWPPQGANYLSSVYAAVEREIGVTPSTDFISGDLFNALMNRVNALIGNVADLDNAEEAPLAVQGASPASGLFSFDKYSSAPILVDAIREAAAAPDSNRRLFLVPRAHVVRLYATGGAVTQLEAVVDGQRRFLPINPNCAVVLAMGAVESTRLALTSFPTALMGRNLMVHLRTNMTVRIRRDAFSPTLPPRLQTAALLVRGSIAQGRFHLQLTASASRTSDSDQLLFRMIPDIDLLDNILMSHDSDFIAMTIRALGEMGGDKVSAVPNGAGSWINLSPFETDEFGVPRAWVNLLTTSGDNGLWDAMDQAALSLAQAFAVNPSSVEYLYDGGWQTQPPTLSKIQQQMRDGLGTTHHESGTLWMGSNGTSVTNVDGRFHHISNAYVADLALFPTVGSANPVLTGLVLAGKIASVIA